MRAFRGLVGLAVVLACPTAAVAAGSVQPGTLSVAAGVVSGTSTCPSAPPTSGPATQTCLGGPTGVAADQSGDIYVADGSSNTVAKITATGSLSIVAGTGRKGAPTPGPATHSNLDNAYDVAVDSTGDVYIDDAGNDVIEKVTPKGVLSVIAGTGRNGAPTPGPATASDLGSPNAIAVGPTGNLYIADSSNNDVEEVTPDGTLSVLAGTGRYGQPTPGPTSQSSLDEPDGVAVDNSGNVYIADAGASAVILKVTPAGRLSVIAGMLHRHGQPTPGPATRSALGGPFSVTADSAGNVYIADLLNYAVDEVTPKGVLSVVAGTGARQLAAAHQIQLSGLIYPRGLAVGPAGDLYIASTQARIVETVTDAAMADAYGRPRLAVGPATVRGREITQMLSCISGVAKCTATATLGTGSGTRRETVLALKRLTIPVGSFKTWTLGPNYAGTRLLRKLGTLSTSLTITADGRTLLAKAVHGILFPASFRKTFLLTAHRP